MVESDIIKDYNLDLDGGLDESESFDLDGSKEGSTSDSYGGLAESEYSMFEIDPNRRVSSRLVTKEMLIADIVEEHPEIVPVIMDYGVHCIGCGASMFETLEEGFAGHGMSDEEIDGIITELNEYISDLVKKQDIKKQDVKKQDEATASNSISD